MLKPENRRRLLVIEDNSTDAFLLRRALDEHGIQHEMTVVEDGESAIDYLKKCNPDSMPELIIIDLNLPRLDGIEVLKKYRNTPALVSSRMMILTSSDSPAERQRAEILGVDAYVRKPILLSEFIQIGATIRSLLDPPAQSAS